MLPKLNPEIPWGDGNGEIGHAYLECKTVLYWEIKQRNKIIRISDIIGRNGCKLSWTLKWNFVQARATPWGPLTVKFRQETWCWNSDIEQQKRWQMTQRYVAVATVT